MIKAAIYDLDDLMVNSYPLHEEAWKPLSKYGIDFDRYPEDLKARFIGTRIIDTLKVLKEYFHVTTDLKFLYNMRQNIFLDLVKTKLEAMPGLIYSLDLFKKLQLKIAVASSGSKEYIDTVLHRFAIKDYFDAVVTGDDVTNGKPNPETFLVACQKLGINPADGVVLEDATKGIAAAKAAGCKCIAIKNPYTPAQDLSQADLTLHTLEEITRTIVTQIGSK